MILYTLHRLNGRPTLSEAAAQLGVAPADLDHAFGVLALDPRKGIYATGVREEASHPGIAQRPGVGGPWADLPIEPLDAPPPPPPEQKS